jgi:hypothetical protein
VSSWLQIRRPALAEIMGVRRAWTVSMISAVSIPSRYTDVTPRLTWPSWRWITLRGTRSRAISTGMGVAKLVWREASPHSGPRRDAAQVVARGGRGPWPPARLTVDHAEQRPDRHLHPTGEPGPELLEAPVVHADLAPLAAMPWRTSSAPRAGSRSGSVRAIASPIRSPARQSTTISARRRSP